MAKSGDNFVILSTLEQKGFHPLDYRYFCLGTQYRTPLAFSFEAMEGAKNARKKLVEKVLELKKGRKNEPTNEDLADNYLQQFTERINDDLNTPQALATMWEMIKDEGLSGKEKYALLLKFDAVFGLDLKKVKEEKIPAQILALVKERLQVRNAKDWKKADELRQKITALGYSVGDTKEGYEVRKV
jgi:cysteinyl-tRNA synthetase